MTSRSRLLGDIARVFVDRLPIDWQSVGSRVARSERTLIENLRYIEGLRQNAGGVEGSPGLGSWWQPALARIVLGLALVQAGCCLGAIIVARFYGVWPAGRTPQTVVAVAFAVACLVQAMAVDAGARRLALMTWFSLIAAIFARAAAIDLPDVWTRPVQFAINGVFLESLAPACVWQFALLVPSTRRFTTFDAIARQVIAWAWAGGVALFALNLGAAYFGAPSGAASYLLRNSPSNLAWRAFTLALVPAVGSIVVRSRRANSAEQRRVRRLALAIGVGTAPLLLSAVVRTLSPSIDTWAHTAAPRLRLWLEAPVFAGLTALPLLVTIALFVDRPLELRVPVRHAFRYALARHAFLFAASVPFVIAALRLYQLRRAPIADLVVSKDLWLFITCGGVIAGLLLVRERLLAWLGTSAADRTQDYDAHLHRALEHIRLARGTRELGARLTQDLQEGTDAAAVHLLVADSNGVMGDSSRTITPLRPDTALVAVLYAALEPLRLSPDGKLFELLPSREREWISANDFAMIAPVRLRDDQIAALVAFEPKPSGAPFNERDRWMVTLATAAAAAAWDEKREAFSAREREVAFECPACGLVADALPLTCACGVAHRLAALPQRVGEHLVVTRRIGAGGMGVVYLAHDQVLGRDVAVKTLPTLAPGAIARLQHEARAMAALNHPALATLFGVEIWRRTPILIVEYFPDGTLADRLARRAHMAITRERIAENVEATVQLGITLAGALGYMHARGVLHRDLKPSNIGITANGSAKLLDFGLASLVGHTPHVRPAGTLAYLPPEALEGAAPSPAVDLWALATILLECCTSTNPFARDRVGSTNSPLDTRDASARATLHAPALQPFFERALALDPTSRFQRAEDLQEAIARSVGHHQPT